MKPAYHAGSCSISMPSLLLHVCSPPPAWPPRLRPGRCSIKLHDLLVSMSVGKEQYSPTDVDSSSDDDDMAHGPGYVTLVSSNANIVLFLLCPIIVSRIVIYLSHISAVNISELTL